ncbi:TRAP transporter large permease [Marinivivus vitaminiproducens]|uniref:TRAP transporter large permease n=1 Tax=Marinivivus vitaminiproducens TaxID=3035935 RepID=UPI0027A04861|nr:TRAP transporter large permease [Geminicoccaceae bacterium SCSIO 64248]
MNLAPAFILLGLFAANVPVAFAMAMAALSFFLLSAGPPLTIFVQRLTAATDSFPLLAVPFFIMAGAIMNHAGITRRLIALAEALVGHWRGGLAQTNIVLATLMGGLSASANADAAMQAKMLGPEMIRRGYQASFVAALTATAAVVTPIIPPGIGLIVYGFLADVSVGRLFLGGVVPGLLICAALMLTTAFIARRRGYGAVRERFIERSELGRAFKDAIWGLTIPLFILLGIRFGVFTPTEAGAMTVLYALAVGFLAHGELKLSDLPGIINETVLATSTVMLIICAASAFGFYMSWERIPPQLAAALVTVSDNPWIMLLLINVLLIGVGMLIEGTAALILLAPILVPVVTELGVDPVHFGLVIVVNLTIGGVTPPVGTLMYTTSTILSVRIEQFTREALPLLGALFLVLVLITYFPGLVLALPNALMGGG